MLATRFRCRSRRLLMAAIAIATAPLVASTPAAAASTAALPSTPTVVARWAMAESAGARTMVDSSGHRSNGAIGSAVKPGSSMGGGRGYAFTAPSASTVSTRGLVLVPYSKSYNPSFDDVHLSLTVQTRGTAEMNLLQNGESGTAGGFYKVEITGGRAGCYVSGSVRQREAWSSVAVNDGAVHVIDCYKTKTYVEVTVDHAHAVKAWDDTGSIANYKAISIGGKSTCTKTSTGAPNCDYFTGLLRSVSISFGPETAS